MPTKGAMRGKRNMWNTIIKRAMMASVLTYPLFLVREMTKNGQIASKNF